MKKLFKRLKDTILRANSKEPEWPPLDINAQIERIKQTDMKNQLRLGQRIICFSYKYFELSLDRDVTGLYRLIVYEGKDRRFSFSIRCKHKDYEALLTCFEEIVQFLDGDRKIKDLPKHDLLHGHYFGN